MGHEVVNIGLKRGKEVHGKKGHSKIEIDQDVKDASVEEFDALFIPGGSSPDNLRAHDEPVRFVREFVESDKPVLLICHAPQLLITAQVLGGRKVTGWRSIVQDLKNAGARYEDREVVEDGNLLSSRQPSDIPAFVEASRKKLMK
jgi:protease I